MTALVVLALALGAPGVRAELPDTLLHAPVNATWAANHADAWRTLGVDGFIWRGIVDGIAPDGGRAFDPDLVDEIALAQQRLAQAELAANFLYLPLVPEGPYFTDRDAIRVFVDRFRSAGRFCADTELRGIAVDAPAASFLFDYRWDGYTDTQRAAGIEADVVDVTRRALRAYFGAHPDGHVLILTEAFHTAGPLWFALFEGFVEAVSGTESLALDVACSTRTAHDLVSFRKALGAIDRRLREHLPPERERAWANQGAVAPRLAPFARAADSYEFRDEYLRAGWVAARYVVVDAPIPSYWHVDAADAGQYAALHQTGPGAVRATGALPAGVVWPPTERNTGGFGLDTPLEGATRIGFTAWHDAPVFVLTTLNGAAAVADDPRLRATVAADRGRTVTPLAPVPDAPVKASPSRPYLFTAGPIPANAVTLPAGVWLTPERALESGMRQARVAFGWKNPLDSPIEGAVTVSTPDGFGLGARLFPIRLAPGENDRHVRTLQGRFSARAPIPIAIALSVPGGGSASRTFTLRPRPRLIAALRMDGPLLGTAVIREPQPRIAVASAAGDWGIATLTGEWIKRVRTQHAFRGPPILFKTADGDWIGIPAHDGRMYQTTTGIFLEEFPPPKAAQRARGPLDLVSDMVGAVHARDATDDVVWIDDRATMPLSERPYLLRDPRGWVYITASTDGFLRIARAE